MSQRAQTSGASASKSRMPNLRDRHKLYPLLMAFLFLGYWYVVYRLERIVLTPDSVPFPVPDFMLKLLPFFSWQVLRHFIPVMIGWFLVYIATLSLLSHFYDLPTSKEARNLLHRLRSPGDVKDRSIQITPQSLNSDREKHVRLKVGGPGLINIPIGNAAISEINGRFYRVMDSGTHQLARFEFVHKVLDLRPQDRKAEDAKFRSSDGFPIRADIGATFRIKSSAETTPQQPYPFDSDSLRELAYDEVNTEVDKVVDWTFMPFILVRVTVNGIISKLTLDQLLTLQPDNREPYLTVRVEHQAREKLAALGVELTRAWVSGVKLPEAASEQFLELWKVDRETQAQIILADGKAEALEEMEIARAEAELTMIQAILEGIKRARRSGHTGTINEIVALRLIEALEKMARQTQGVPGGLLPQIYSLQQGILLEGQVTPINPDEPVRNGDN